MSRRPISVVPATLLREGFEAIRRELGVAVRFPAEVEAEACAVAPRARGGGERVDLPLVTIDPPGSRDLDQALHVERLGDGHRVHAIEGFLRRLSVSDYRDRMVLKGGMRWRYSMRGG